MSESIKTGGVGKSPAIEKINRLNAISSRMQAAALMEEKAFYDQQEKAAAALLKRQQIIEDFQISFLKK